MTRRTATRPTASRPPASLPCRRPMAAAALLALALGAASPARAEAPAAPFSIVALGSSSTQGTGASGPAMSYPAQLQRLFDDRYAGRPAVAVLNEGVAGEDIDDMAKRLEADVLSRHPDLVIWQAGSNDPLRGVPMDRFEAELKSGIDAIRAGGAEVVLMEPQWSPVIERADAKERFVDAVREVGAQEHVEVVRRFALMRGWIDGGIITPPELIAADGLHMTDRGYGLLARAVLDQIADRSAAFRARRSLALTVTGSAMTGTAAGVPSGPSRTRPGPDGRQPSSRFSMTEVVGSA